MTSKKLPVMLFVLLGLAGLGILGWSLYKKQYLRGKVNDVVAGGSQGLYSIAFGKLDLDEVGGNLAVTQLVLRADTVRYNQLLEAGNAPSILAQLSIPSLKVRGVKTPKALLNKEIAGGKVLIENPQIELFFTNKGKDSSMRVPDKELYEQLLGSLSKIALDTVSIVNATVITRNLGDGRKLMQFDSVQIDLFKVAVDSIHSKDSTRLLFAENASLWCKKISWMDKKELYVFEVKEVDFNTRGQRMGIARFAIIPQLPETKFLQQFKYATDRFDIDMKDIRLVNLNVASLMRQSIMADSMIVQNSQVNIYRDISYPHDGANRLRELPHQQLMRISVPLMIKEASFHNSFIEYKERNGKSEKSGKVQFHKVGVHISNLTNDTNALKNAAVCKLRFNARFLNQAPIRAVINFFPLDRDGKFTIEGSLGAMPATAVNALAVPMGLAKIEKGMINRLNFFLTGNDYRADGKVTILYKDLGVALLKKDEEENKLEKKKLASLVAGIVIKKSNPGNKGDIRTANVHFERDTHRSFFHLVWKSIFTGVKENVGM